MNEIPHPNILDVVPIAREAGAAILRFTTQDFSVLEKDDKSPLTEADLASHRIIKQRLRTLTPEHPDSV